MEEPIARFVPYPKPQVPISQMTNGEFFAAFCFWEMSDMRIIQRMVDAMLKRKGVADKPLWVRQDTFDSWLKEPFDEAGWSRAKYYTQLSL